jgi:hypothetical protein
VDGEQKGVLADIDNATHRINQVRLGAINGIDSGTPDNYYFDAFESTRQSYIVGE